MNRYLRDIFVTVVLLAVAVGFCFFASDQADAERISIESNIADRQKALADLNYLSTETTDITNRCVALQHALSLISQRLPTQERHAGIVRALSELAAANHLEVLSIRLQPLKVCESYAEQPLQISASGDFADFHQYLAMMEQMPEPLRTVQLRVHKSDLSDGHVSADIVVNSYFQPTPSHQGIE